MKKKPSAYPSQLRALIPVNTPDLNTLSLPDGISPDDIRAVFNQMYIVRSKQSRIDEKDRPNYFATNHVPLNAEVMYAILSKPYRKILTWMEEQGFLSVYLSSTDKRSYIPGKRSMLYKIAPHLLIPNQAGKHFRVEYIKQKRLIKAIIKNNLRHGFDDEKLSAINPVLPELRKMCSAAYFLSDEAWVWMNDEVVSCDIKPIQRSLFFFKMEQHNSLEFVEFFTDTFGQRIHTTFTSLKKGLRQFIRFRGHDDENVTLIDLKNSQPYFASLLLNHPSLLERFLPEFLPLKKIIDEGMHDTGVKIFHRTCADGLLYRDWLLARGYIKDEGETPSDEQKKLAKAEMLGIIMYAPVGNYAADKKLAYDKRRTKLQFSLLYGKAWNIFSKIKTVGKDVLPFMDKYYFNRSGKYAPEKSRHKNLSAMIQRLESRILLWYVAQRLIDKGIYPFVTIHDCFVLPASLAAEARKEITSAFAELGVIPPSVDISEAGKC